jgi:coenzyme Q-binding protein COQ10
MIVIRNIQKIPIRNLHLKTLFSQQQSHVFKRTLNHPPELFYKVVSDVASYHEFIPYCTRSFITKHDDNSLPMEGGLRVGWRNIEEEFVCDLHCEPHHLVVAESTTHSLFEHLYTKWTVEPNERRNSCDMSLELEYKFKSELYNKMSSMFAKSVSDLVIGAFDKRARELRRRERKGDK